MDSLSGEFRVSARCDVVVTTSGRSGAKAPHPARKRSRPDSRTALVKLRLTAQERRAWKARADALGVSLSEMIRANVSAAPLTVLEATDPALLHQVRRVGLTLNQIARHANGGLGIDTRRLDPAIDAAHRLFLELLRSRRPASR